MPRITIEEAELTHPVEWGDQESDETTICCVTHYGADGNTKYSMRPQSWFDWVKKQVSYVMQLNQLIGKELHDDTTPTN